MGQNLYLQPQLGMRPQTHQPQRIRAELLVDQHQVRFEVAVAMITPVTRQRVIAVLRLQRNIRLQRRQNSVKLGIEQSTIAPFFSRR